VKRPRFYECRSFKGSVRHALSNWLLYSDLVGKYGAPHTCVFMGLAHIAFGASDKMYLFWELLYYTLGGAGEVPHTLMGRPTRTPPSCSASLATVFLPRPPPSASSAIIFLPRPRPVPQGPTFLLSPFDRLHLRRRRAPPNPKTPPPILSTRACSATSAAGRGVGGFVAPPGLTSAGDDAASRVVPVADEGCVRPSSSLVFFFLRL
jgi:hypothetical protein